MAAAEYGLAVLVIVFNNGKYLSMRHNHRRVYPDSVAARTGYQLIRELTARSRGTARTDHGKELSGSLSISVDLARR